MAVAAHASHYRAAWHSLLVEGDVDHVLARLERHEADREARVTLRRHLRRYVLAASRYRDLQVSFAGLTRVDCGDNERRTLVEVSGAIEKRQICFIVSLYSLVYN